jgi:hypothetical protein
MSTTSTPALVSSFWIASLPVSGRDDVHALALQHARDREDVPDVVVDDEHLLAGEHLVGRVEPLDPLALLRRQLRDGTVEVEARLVDEPVDRTAPARTPAEPVSSLEAFPFRLGERGVGRREDDRDPAAPRTAGGSRRAGRARMRAAAAVSSTTQSKLVAVQRPQAASGVSAECTRTPSPAIARELCLGGRVRREDQQVRAPCARSRS